MAYEATVTEIVTVRTKLFEGVPQYRLHDLFLNAWNRAQRGRDLDLQQRCRFFWERSLGAGTHLQDHVQRKRYRCELKVGAERHYWGANVK